MTHDLRQDRSDVYFSADVETDGPIPGPFSMLSFGLVVAGAFDGTKFTSPLDYKDTFYSELRPISDRFDPEALQVNGLDREELRTVGREPHEAMTAASRWIASQCEGRGRPVLVAYPLSFDWTWLYWYFIQFSSLGSPFDHARCFDLKTAFAVKARLPISQAGRSKVPQALKGPYAHTHNALADAIEQAAMFANIFQWEGPCRTTPA